MAAMGVSLSVMISAYISLIIGPRGLVCEIKRTPKLKSAYNLLIIGPAGDCNLKPTYRKLWAGNLLLWSDLTLGPSFKVK